MTAAEPPDRLHRIGQIMRVDSVTAEVVAHLGSRGIRTIVLKGPSFGRWLYDDKTDRPYSDTDLLVAPDRAGAVAEALGELGFEVAIPRHELDRPVPATNWIRRRGGAAVDVHVGLTGAAAPLTAQWELLSSDVERMSVGGLEVEVLAPPARALHAALHLAQHGPDPRQVRDVELAVAKVPLETWRDAAVLAGRLGAVAALAGGLRLVPEGAELADQLELPDARSVEGILREEQVPLALGLKWISELPGGRAKLRLIRAKLFPAPDEIVPDPRRRTSLAVAAAYATNLLRMTRQIVPAWRALRRARRDARPGTGRERGTNRVEKGNVDESGSSRGDNA